MELPNQQYVTIKEFATLANVTTQAVYKRLNQTDSALNQYVQYSGKLKLINKDALELFSDNLQSQRDEYDGQDVSAYNDINVQNQNNLFSAYFDTTIKVLSDQITSKDGQIKELMNCNLDQHQKLQEQLMTKDKQISELQKLIDQQQQLHRAEQEQFRMLTTASNEKKGLFKRLFNKKEQETAE